MRVSENDHASSVVRNTKRIVHVFRVPVVMMMRFVATNVDGEVTETEWSTYINDHLNVSPGRKKKTSTVFC